MHILPFLYDVLKGEIAHQKPNMDKNKNKQAIWDDPYYVFLLWRHNSNIQAGKKKGSEANQQGFFRSSIHTTQTKEKDLDAREFNLESSFDGAAHATSVISSLVESIHCHISLFYILREETIDSSPLAVNRSYGSISSAKAGK